MKKGKKRKTNDSKGSNVQQHQQPFQLSAATQWHLLLQVYVMVVASFIIPKSYTPKLKVIHCFLTFFLEK